MKWPDIDLQRLSELNGDTIGWIHLDGTPIDYPVVRDPGNGYYFDHNFGREESVHGCIFANDYGSELSGRRKMFFGHAMKDETMFTYVQHFHYSPGFFEAHPVVKYLTPEGMYAIRVWAAVNVALNMHNIGHIPVKERTFEPWLHLIRQLSTIHGEREPHFGEDLVALCTCRPFTTPKPDGSLFVYGFLEPSSDS